MQLEQRISEELEQNPMLEMEEKQKQDEEKPKETVNESGQVKTDSTKEDGKGDFTEAEWTKYMEDGFDRNYSIRREHDPNIEEFEPIQIYLVTLADHLLEQLGMVVRNEEDRLIGEFIIGSINGDGFLEISYDEIAENLGVKVEDVTRMVKIIQKFDPSGVAARDLRETLLIQLQERGEKDSIAWKVIKDYYKEF